MTEVIGKIRRTQLQVLDLLKAIGNNRELILCIQIVENLDRIGHQISFGGTAIQIVMRKFLTKFVFKYIERLQDFSEPFIPDHMAIDLTRVVEFPQLSVH